MNPDTNRFEPLTEQLTEPLSAIEEEFAKQMKTAVEAPYGGFTKSQAELVRPDGTPVPKHWSTFTVGNKYEINGYTFTCAYIGETSILFEPAGPIVVGDANG